MLIRLVAAKDDQYASHFKYYVKETALNQVIQTSLQDVSGNPADIFKIDGLFAEVKIDLYGKTCTLTLTDRQIRNFALKPKSYEKFSAVHPHQIEKIVEMVVKKILIKYCDLERESTRRRRLSHAPKSASFNVPLKKPTTPKQTPHKSLSQDQIHPPDINPSLKIASAQAFYHTQMRQFKIFRHYLQLLLECKNMGEFLDYMTTKINIIALALKKDHFPELQQAYKERLEHFEFFKSIGNIEQAKHLVSQKIDYFVLNLNQTIINLDFYSQLRPK